MFSDRFQVLALFVSGAFLSGCATPLSPEPTAELTHCLKTNKGRVIACTELPAPSLAADAEAKRFAPDPEALTVYVVRRNWGDSRNFVKVRVDGGPGVQTLPDTMVRMKLRPGAHTIAFEFEGGGQSKLVEGRAGDVRFVRIDGMVWSWNSTYQWADESEEKTRERALKARLVANLAF